MNLETIRNLTDEELVAQVKQSGEQLFRVRFQKSMGNLEGLKSLKAHKLQIAQVKTIQKERLIAAEMQKEPVPKAIAPGPSQRTSRKKAKKV